jgi:FKBP-type peptidyl-prolyl cis-trans isomerase FkpA
MVLFNSQTIKEMRKSVSAVFISCLIIALSGCVKDEGCTEKTAASEQGAMTTFATTNGFVTQSHSSGIQYQITNPGNPSIVPTISSTVKVKYTGKYMNGTIFDSNATGVDIPLSNVIAGWQIGIPFIGKGGSIKLLIPSSLAYGCAGRNPIPSYSVLYFEVELIDVL